MVGVPNSEIGVLNPKIQLISYSSFVTNMESRARLQNSYARFNPFILLTTNLTFASVTCCTHIAALQIVQ